MTIATKTNAVVLTSGGLDSAVLLHFVSAAGITPIALSFNYNQRHRAELAYACKMSEHLHIRHIIADLTAIHPLIQKGSQTGEIPPPEGHYTDTSMKTTIVPNRNAIMLSIAVGFAVAHDIHEVYYAAHAGDHTIYPDCRPDFFEAFRCAMREGNLWNTIDLHGPFLDKSKAEVVTLGHNLHVPFELTYSCYAGNPNHHCGKCGTCVERREAFQIAGVEDPTVYAL